IRYRGAGSSRSTSRTVPERARRSVDSDSASTRSPTSNVIEVLPSIAALRAYGLRRAGATGFAFANVGPDERPRSVPGQNFGADASARLIGAATLKISQEERR